MDKSITFFFLLNFCWTHVHFWGYPLIPLFWTSGDVSSGFQSQRGFCLIQILQRWTCNTFPEIRLQCDTSASVYSQHNSWSLSPHACFSRGRIPDLNHRPPAWQMHMLTTQPQRPGTLLDS